MIVSGSKINEVYARSLTAFDSPVEFGVTVPFNDYKFLRAYESNNIDGTPPLVPPLSTLPLKIDMSDKIQESYIKDFDEKLISNAIIGPSTDYTNNSKGMIVSRPCRKTADKIIEIAKDSDDGGSTLSLNLNDMDNVLMATEPLFASTKTTIVSTNGTTRTPAMAGISKHTNSYICNEALGFIKINFDQTGKSTIDPNFLYRFSFYYRAKATKDITMTVSIACYANDGAHTTTFNYLVADIISGADETSDFNYFAITIPNTNLGMKFPDNTRRIQISLNITAVLVPLTFEMIYPVLEHSFKVSLTSGFLFIPYAPSDISAKKNSSTNLKISPNGTNTVYDSTKLFPAHIGRDLFSISLSWDLIDATFINEMRIIEQMNSMGYSIALRPKHPNLPPVMVGDIKVQSTNTHFDFNMSDLSIQFEETV